MVEDRDRIASLERRVERLSRDVTVLSDAFGRLTGVLHAAGSALHTATDVREAAALAYGTGDGPR